MTASTGVHASEELSRTMHDLALADYEEPHKPDIGSRDKYTWLRELGSRLWLDTGDAAAAGDAWSEELEALTTNNTLVNQVVQAGSMDGLIGFAVRKLREAQPSISEPDLIMEVGFLVNAKIALGLVQRFGARVSVELHPDLGSDIEGILVFARRYFAINPDYFYVKVPLTPDGFVAVRKLSTEGIPVNFTLGFSARQNYLASWFSRPSFVNVFLGRLNQLVEENSLGKGENVGEKAALASDEMVKNLRMSQPDLPTRQIAASLRNGAQVCTLAGVDVLTIPPKAALDYLKMDISREDIYQHNWRDLQVEINKNEQEHFARLWEIDKRFIGFVEDASRKGDSITCGEQLIELSDKHNVDLFYDWSDEDRQKIREHGKIPDVLTWHHAPIDDLMSVAALESFAKDQLELDERISRWL